MRDEATPDFADHDHAAVGGALDIGPDSSRAQRTIDITTTGRRVGLPRRIEIWSTMSTAAGISAAARSSRSCSTTSGSARRRRVDAFNPDVKGKQIDVTKTYTDKSVQAAK